MPGSASTCKGGSPDLVSTKLAALRSYQHSLATPAPPAGSYDAAAAGRGQAVFGKACAGCHVGGNGTDNNDGKLHKPAETGMDGAYAERTANKAYRTTPLRALWQHPPYFHDGSAETLADVVEHYDRVRASSSRRREEGSRRVPEVALELLEMRRLSSLTGPKPWFVAPPAR